MKCHVLTLPSSSLPSLSLLPQVDEAEVLVADTSGENVDNKTRLDLIRQQEQFIKKEAEEKELEVRRTRLMPNSDTLFVHVTSIMHVT